MINNISILKNITILYAEDEASLREITLNILKGFTKKQFVAKDGQEGLELFKENEEEIDLIITDVNMPHMNGLEMIKEIKQINPNIPIIVATAFSNTEYLLEAIDIGVDKYVLKPIDMKKLLQTMSQSLLYHELKDLYIDKLTHLPNRNRLKKDLAQTEEDLMALINIDKFSTINDLFGENNGDKILSEFSDNLKKHFCKQDYKIYRIEADKFAVVSKKHDKDIYEFKKLCKTFADNIQKDTIIIDDNEIDLNVTIGIAKGDGNRAYKYSQRVISYARNKFEQVMIYDDSFNIQESFEENIKWVKKIKNGLKNGNFKGFYQPIVDNKTQEIYKYEALIRFIEDDGEVIAPFKFLDIAKKAKLYPHVIKVMLKEALLLIKAKNKRVAVNISFEDIASDETQKFIYEELKNEPEATKLLEFEILESEEISDIDIVKSFIKDVKALGCTVGVDDFGAGYSNFNMLTNLDIDFVKIDSSLIKEIDHSKNQEIIVNTISNFSKEFGFTTVAEFVSSKEIYEKVKSLDIDYSQGYHFGKPMSFDEV
ncbi:diguanylate cyclase [Malaciobacter canalis]|jgi:diguanylate cyclase (GGDEF)-like protein|uniref:Diguanylate cyclase n=1 Tax=Malaciobacter canalis TaxID=1912871 RepID=A0ABX4LT39_9BACT|nr:MULTISPECIES: EAL domain-containing protein [Malaciobacter]PHO09366.1 diguanylate cyclase [Malaciobacter canalis]QEE32179.1 response regulator receiver-modulated diguanylate cyclase/phosphodiesterase [Malaciobacter canalis]SKB30144.1 diguanylate cyclase (GGDEF) domain-containing protein [Malaciobacter marinus]